MNLELYVENINRQLAVAAEAGGDEARALAERLVAPLEAAIRLTLQDALAAAAEEITTELAPGSVELRLRGRDPEFVVTPPPADPSADDRTRTPTTGLQPVPEGDEGAMSRINLRMPDHLKTRIEQAAASEGLSVNAWLVRAAAAALERTGPARRRERRASPGRPALHGLGTLANPQEELQMPTFDTPEPISVTVELGVGDLRIVASDRTDTMVEVRPSDPAKKADVTAAEQTRVEYAGGRLLIKAPKSWRQLSWRGGGESIDVQVELPAGSHLRGETGVAALRCQGRLGECRYKTGVGDIQLDQAGAVQLRTGVGDVTVERAAGDAELTTGSGAVRIDRIDGAAVVKNSNGDTWIGEVTGDLRVNAANGRISVDRARETVAAKSANGDVRLGEVAHGAVVAQTGFGKVEIGVRDGVAAWLDLNTRFGNVHNDLDAAERPGPGEDAVEVRARTSFGDITIHRSVANDTGKDET